jgi:hypothetical protein
MDPFLEDPAIWPDFHQGLALEIRNELNRVLPRPYYARVEIRPELGIVEDETGACRRIVPDVTVVRHPDRPPSRGTATLERPRRELSRWVEPQLSDELFSHHFVEIRDAQRAHKLITLLEILSPSNKAPGPDRDAYGAKQRDVLESDASLIEIDLLRTGAHVLPSPALATFVAELNPRPDYLVMVSRASKRATSGLNIGYVFFPFNLVEWLPCIPVPLKPEEPEVTLDLQFPFNAAYEGGPYLLGAIDYSKPPVPALTGPDANWAEQLLRERGLGPGKGTGTGLR